MIISGSSNSTGSPLPTRICLTVPACGAGIWFMVFMASMIMMVWPALTCEPTCTNGAAPGEGEK